jgi:hypothetical protein
LERSTHVLCADHGLQLLRVHRALHLRKQQGDARDLLLAHALQEGGIEWLARAETPGGMTREGCKGLRQRGGVGW